MSVGTHRASKSHRGASLIEVLVALLIISLGLMSMARLSATTIGYNKGAQVRLVALSLANAYTERARLNVYGFDLAGYNIALNEALPDAPLINADANDITAASAVAQADKREFMQRVAAHLPQGLVVANSAPAADARNLDIWILWQDVNTEESGGLRTAGESQCPAGVHGNTCLYIKVRL